MPACNEEGHPYAKMSLGRHRSWQDNVSPGRAWRGRQRLLVRKKFTQRRLLLTYTANMQTALIGMEACSGAHFLGRALRKQGHDVVDSRAIC